MTRHAGIGRDMPHSFVVLDEVRPVRYVRVTAGHLPFGGAFAVSGLRVFGLGSGQAPTEVTPRATRVDGRQALIEWDAAHDAQGYNVRYGLNPEKLYRSWLVYEQTDLDLRALNAEADYWVAVDAFDENGITPGRPVPIQRRPS
ncbi:hypothetical protein [Cryptosporangium minutisporangium]|uniref:Fibronectin type-III domain-containing protein n=1 Tax=Cryptosporangium minutisporangium TaxID=113569 RepID=A0ABP6SYP2_9ACTN